MVGFYIVFYFLVEVLPSVAVLYVMRTLPKPVHQTDKLLNRLPAHLQVVSSDSENQGTSSAFHQPYNSDSLGVDLTSSLYVTRETTVGDTSFGQFIH